MRVLGIDPGYAIVEMCIRDRVSIFGGMLDKGEKWAFLEDKFPKSPFQRRGTAV